jgi:hypothetical protein
MVIGMKVRVKVEREEEFMGIKEKVYGVLRRLNIAIPNETLDITLSPEDEDEEETRPHWCIIIDPWARVDGERIRPVVEEDITELIEGLSQEGVIGVKFINQKKRTIRGW